MDDGKFAWDDSKSETNNAKHGIDFQEARELWKAGVDEFPSPRPGQMRYVAFGKLGGRLALVVVTYRGAKRRIISARYANEEERSKYEDTKKGQKGKR